MAASIPRKLAGFSLVELMVVIGLVGMLFAITLKGISVARESSRRSLCANNLRTQVQAALQYEAAFRHLPSNGWGNIWIAVRDRGFEKRQPGGWLYGILPYLEESSLSQLAPSADGRSTASEMHRFSNSMVPAYMCPSRAGAVAIRVSDRFRPPVGSAPDLAARVDYAINGGSASDDCGFRHGPASLAEGDSPAYPWSSSPKCNGVAFARSEIRLREITNGQSHVIFCGEKRWNGAGDQGMNQPMFSGDAADNRRFTDGCPLRDALTAAEEVYTTYFGSSHVGVTGFAMCDGSVDMLDFGIDPFVFRAMGERSRRAD